MIIKGGARNSGGLFASHLMKTEENERVEVKEMRGLLADTVPEPFSEMRMVAAGTRAGIIFTIPASTHGKMKSSRRSMGYCRGSA